MKGFKESQDINRETGSEQTVDLKIRDALNREAEQLQVSSRHVKNMQQSVHNRIQEGNGMKHKSIKKFIVAAAIICTLGGITAVAAGRIASISSHSNWKEAFYDYNQIDKMEQKLGYTMKAPKSFTNGFTFSSGIPNHQEAQDDNGNAIKQIESLSLTYTKSGMPDITLEIQGDDLGEEAATPDKVLTYNGIRLSYSTEHFRFVPADYKLSAEEQAAIDAGQLAVSYGASKVTDNVFQLMSWKDDGVTYKLLAFDSSMSPEDFEEMAGEIIEFKGE